MSCTPHRNLSNTSLSRIAAAALLAGCLAAGIRSAEQAPGTSKPQAEAQAELQRRVEEAQLARASLDSYRLKKASEKVIALALREMAQLRLLESAYAQSAELYRRSLDFEEDHDTRVDLAIAEIGRFNADAAIAQLVPVLESHPDDLRALIASGRAWTLKKNYGKAAEYLALNLALTEKSADPPIRAMLGMAYYASDRYADAVRAFSPFGSDGMRDPLAGYAWAASLAKLGDLKRASTVLAEMEHNELPPETLLLVAQLWLTVEDYSRAISTIDRAFCANPSLLRAHYFKGMANLLGEHHQQAATEFAAELSLNPNDVEAKDNLGFVYMEASRTNEAMALFQSVLAAHPGEVTAHYQIGKILLDRGKTAEALAHLEFAARQSPDTDYIHYQLQAAYRKAARLADAERELQIYKEIKARKRAGATVPVTSENP